jgi:hypothetical protein
MQRRISLMNTLSWKAGGNGRAAMVLAGILLGACALASAGQATKQAPKPAAKPAAPAKPAAAAKPAAPARPAAPAKPAATPARPAAGGASAAHAPSAGGASAARPTGNGAGTAARPSTTAGRPAGASTGAARGAGPRAASGSKTETAKNGARVTMRRDGRVSDVHDAKRGMEIHHGLDGSRRVSVQRRDGSRLVAERGRAGYVQRGFSYHGHEFARRSYYFNGREYDRFYRSYGYRGLALDVYAPGFYFASAFYGWAYNPWAAPIAFGWGWAGNPWFGFYGGFFTPYAVYPSAAFWLTDYLIAQDLQAAYAARDAASSASVPQLVDQKEGGPGPANEHNLSTWAWNGNQYEMTFNGAHCGNLTVVKWDADGVVLTRADFNGFKAVYNGRFIGDGRIAGTVNWNPTGEPHMGTWSASFTPVAAPAPQPTDAAGVTPLSPDVKQLIADEVRSQLALENAEAAQTAQNQDVDAGSSGIARLLDEVAHGKPHMFVVGGGLDVTDASSGQECHVSDGDALQLTTAPASDATAATLAVRASKGGVECTPGSMVSVNLTDLQEMQNHMRENIDVGLKQLQANQGHGGLPQAPSLAQAAPAPAQFAALAPPPSPQDAADIQAQTKQADQAEAEAQGNQ